MHITCRWAELLSSLAYSAAPVRTARKDQLVYRLEMNDKQNLGSPPLQHQSVQEAQQHLLLDQGGGLYVATRTRHKWTLTA